MSLIGAYRSFNSLTDEQKLILREKHVEGTHTTGEWIALLMQVAKYDQSADELRKGVGWTIFIAIVLAIFGGIFSGIFLVALFFALLAIAAIILYRRLKAFDVANLLREFILPLLSLLREDIESEQPLQLKIELDGATTKKKELTSERLPGPRSVTQTMYQDEWMSGDTVLADGTSLLWDITDLVRQRVVTKTNPRGKTKSKTKYKVRRIIEMRVGMRRDSYALGGESHDASQHAVAVKEGAKRTTLKVRRLLLASTPNVSLDVKDFMDTLAAAYRRITLAPQEGK